jgi:VIT1/CCC1 family predicted Fe2+/Mn2+ transporter
MSSAAENTQAETDYSALFRTLSELESDPDAAKFFHHLACVEKRHADFWRKRAGSSRPPQPSFRTRLLQAAARRFGPSVLLPHVTNFKHLDSATGIPDPEQRSASHAGFLRGIGSRGGAVGGSLLAQLEGRHGSGGGNVLRAVILGANDGIVSNLSLVMGVAGASFQTSGIVIAGFAGLLAGSCSMALGEWLSVSNSREAFQREINVIAGELRSFPDEEEEELTLIYQAKGLDRPHAGATAAQIMSNREAALDTIAREEFGVDPAELGGSAWAAAGSSFLLFATGAFFPVAPFLFFSGLTAVLGSIGLSGLALASLGAMTSKWTGRGIWFSIGRQLGIGFGAAAFTYGVGRLLGVASTG